MKLVDHSESTPLTDLNLLGMPVLVKRESSQPSGSHKDRVARVKVQSLKDDHGLGTTLTKLILSSSGNTANAFATYTADILGVELHVVADVLSPRKHLAALDRYGHVKLHTVDDPDSTGSHLTARMSLIGKLEQKFRSSGEQFYTIDQYRDPLFAMAHELSLAAEIENQVDGPIAAIIVAGGTCATLRGLVQYKTNNNRDWELVPVDAEGSKLFDPVNDDGRRVFSGHGNGRQTEFAKSFQGTFAPVRPSNIEVARMARWLLVRHALYVGPSSAAVAAAFAALLREPHYRLPHYGQIVLVMPDGGENYSETLHNDDWLIEQGLGHAASL